MRIEYCQLKCILPESKHVMQAEKSVTSGKARRNMCAKYAMIVRHMQNHSLRKEIFVWPWSCFTFIWTRVLNHNKYVEIKQFFKVDIKQNISTVILFIKFLVYQWDPIHLQGSRVVYIFVYIMKFVFYLISNHIFVYINHKDTC